MRKKREFIEGAFYHVTSRTNDKIRVFENNLGRRMMLIVLQDAKDKFNFHLANFCIMPTHIHLLIQPTKGTNLSVIMQWIKSGFARRWNFIHGSTDHVWGHRYFTRAIKDSDEFEFVTEYIDKNPVVAGLAEIHSEWIASGAYYKERNIPGLVDFFLSDDCQPCNESNSPIPKIISRLLPPAQLSHVTHYFGAYANAIDRLNDVVKNIPKLGETEAIPDSFVHLHYCTKTAEYFIYEYDGDDKMYGKVRFSFYPSETEYNKFSLAKLKNNQYMELDLFWNVSNQQIKEQ